VIHQAPEPSLPCTLIAEPACSGEFKTAAAGKPCCYRVVRSPRHLDEHNASVAVRLAGGVDLKGKTI